MADDVRECHAPDQPDSRPGTARTNHSGTDPRALDPNPGTTRVVPAARSFEPDSRCPGQTVNPAPRSSGAKPDAGAATGAGRSPGYPLRLTCVSIRSVAVSPTFETQTLREEFFHALLEATRPLQGRPDPELALEVLIEAVSLLEDRLRAKLAELRQEQVD